MVIRRGHLVEDAFAQLARTSQYDLKKPLRVSFYGEQAVDAGGPTKEFFLLAVKELFDPNFGMFVISPETQTFYFRPDSLENAVEFELVGILLGLAVYNGALLSVHFPLALYKKLMGRPVGLADLELLKPAYAKSLKQLLEYVGDDVESVFCLTFTVDVDSFGSVKTVELVPGGRDINVTKGNKEVRAIFVSFPMVVCCVYV